jgi:hypothetical protein
VNAVRAPMVGTFYRAPSPRDRCAGHRRPTHDAAGGRRHVRHGQENLGALRVLKQHATSGRRVLQQVDGSGFELDEEGQALRKRPLTRGGSR